jgi:hypothetical protein
MTRRDLLQAAGGLALGISAAEAADAPVPAVGPQLFLDDFLIARSEGLARVPQQPVKLEQPVLTSERFGVTQPYLSVLRDPDTGRLRMWYNRGPAIWHTESEDGLWWGEPQVAWDVQRGYGVSIVAGHSPEPERKYRLASWQSDKALDDTPQDNGGMFVGFSPDGLRWPPYAANPVLRTYPTAWPKIEAHGVGDTVDAFWDPIRQRYGCAVKVHALPEDGYAPAPRAGKVYRRLIGMTTSDDFLHWQKPWRIHVPDARDEGLLEFYGMGATHARGPLLIGMVRVLRDDLPCDEGGPKEGIGYTTLATSRDGIKWERFREPFLDRSPERGSWDHAMAWASAVLPVGDELFLYYGGYARGHKIEPTKERQIGMARMKRDRYVARSAGGKRGTLQTRPLLLEGSRVTVNAAIRSEFQARVLDAAGKPIPGFDWPDGSSVRGNGVALPLRWKRPLAELRAKPVRLEFALREAELFALEVLP